MITVCKGKSTGVVDSVSNNRPLTMQADQSLC